jgi:hypothetical protein
MEKQKTKGEHVGGLFGFFPQNSRELKEMQLLLIRKIKKGRQGKEEKRPYKSIGVTISLCVDKNGNSYIHDQQGFLTHLKNNLEATYGFSQQVAEEIISIEKKAGVRGYRDYALIVAFLSKSKSYPLVFKQIFFKSEPEVERNIYCVRTVLTQHNQSTSNPSSLNGLTTFGIDCIRREIKLFYVKEAIDELFHPAQTLAATLVALDAIVRLFLFERFDSKTVDQILKQNEKYLKSILGS